MLSRPGSGERRTGELLWPLGCAGWEIQGWGPAPDTPRFQALLPPPLLCLPSPPLLSLLAALGRPGRPSHRTPLRGRFTAPPNWPHSTGRSLGVRLTEAHEEEKPAPVPAGARS